jgi:hypothetical protein
MQGEPLPARTVQVPAFVVIQREREVEIPVLALLNTLQSKSKKINFCH